jgi:hypothetical protein
MKWTLPTSEYLRWRLRQQVQMMFRGPVLCWHQLQWLVSSPAAIDAWTERHLHLGDSFWLFVLGLNNSGTSLLCHILGQHSQIRQLPSAGQGLTSAIPRARDLGLSRNWTKKPEIFRWTEQSDPSPVLRIRYDWTRFYPRRPGILLEKSPPNTMRSRWLQRHFRPCRFVAIVRNPYAVCEGIRRREGIPLEEAALHWRRGNEYLLEDLPFLERAQLFSYEALCAEPERHLQLLEDFLELKQPINRSILIGTIPSHNLEGRPLRIANLNEKSLSRLSCAEKKTISQIAEPLLTQLGYRV